MYDPSAVVVPEPMVAPLNRMVYATAGAILPDIVVVILTGPESGTAVI